MYHTISENEFLDAFRGGKTSWSDTYKNNFSYYALIALFESLENLEDDTGKERKFDRVELIGDYNEYDSLKEFHSEYSMPEVKTLDDLSDHTTVIKVDDPDRVGAFIMGVF
tara:strand:- start:447 stop:779 length:333 start_codon:yes stop_codon:yes gene_type:complete